MVRAVQRGAKYTAEHPEDQPRSWQVCFRILFRRMWAIAQVKATVELFHTPNTEGKPYGWQSDEDWENTIALMYDNGGIETRLENATDYLPTITSI